MAAMAKWCIGIDLGGTFIKFIALDEQRRRTETLQLPTPSRRNDVAEQMIAGAKKLIEDCDLGRDQIVAVGIGSPGPLDLTGGIIIDMPNIPDMAQMPIRDMVSEGLSLPATLENDANAAGFGEYTCGAGSGGGDMVLLTLGTGLGSGIIVNGRVLHGSHDIGAEFGHLIVVPDGEPCGCGQRGCLERYCSATYIAQAATREIVEQGRSSSLADIHRRRGAITAKDINEARRAGDELAAEVWDRGIYFLALACVNICRIFDPERIVFAGGMTKAGEDLMAPLREHFLRLHWKLTEVKTELALAELGNDAGAIGAAAVAWQAFR